MDAPQGVTITRVREVMEDPDDVESPERGITRFVGHGYEVIVGDDGQTVLSVRPLVPIGQNEPGRHRTHRAKPGARRSLPETVSEVVKLLHRDDFTVEPGRGGRWKVTRSGMPGKTLGLPAAPSDHRWAENTRRDLRAMFGYDPRDPSR